MTLGSLAFRNALRRRRRYAPAFVNLAIFGLAFTLLTGIGESFVRNLESRAVVYYGGEGTLLTYRQGPGFWDDTARDPAEVRALTAGLAWVEGVGLRHVYRQPGTELIAGSRSVTLRILTGVDPAPTLADRWDLEAGTADLGVSEVLLPRSAAQALGVGPGAPVVLSLRTYAGQRNTVHLTVAGVYRDDPLFGRGVAYVDRLGLNRWSGKPADYGSENSLQTFGPLDPGRIEALNRALAVRWSLWPHPADKKAFLVQYLTERWDGPKSVVFGLADHLKDLAAVVAALTAGLNLAALLLLVVAALGLGSTLRILLHERTREIGTIRALGMGEGRVFRLLLIEVESVAFLATVTGVLAGYGVLFGLSGLSWAGVTLVQPLLIHGSLGYSWSAGPGLAAVAWSLGAAWVVARGPLVRASRGQPARALEAAI